MNYEEFALNVVSLYTSRMVAHIGLKPFRLEYVVNSKTPSLFYINYYARTPARTIILYSQKYTRTSMHVECFTDVN